MRDTSLSDHKNPKVNVMVPGSNVTGTKINMNPRVNIMVSRSKVTGTNFYTCAYKPCIHNPQVHIDHDGINTLDTGGSTRLPRSRPRLHGQWRQDLNSMSMHIYPSWAVHRHGLATLTSIPWTQQHQQDFQGQGHSSKVKGHRTRIP